MITHSMKEEDVENIIVEDFQEDYEEDMDDEYKEEDDKQVTGAETMEMIIEPGKYNYGNVYFQTVSSTYVVPHHPNYEVINEEQVKTSE